MTPETDVIILASREDPSSSILEAVAERVGLCSDIDALVRQALRERTFALVFDALSRIPSSVNPPFVEAARSRLRAYTIGAWSRQRTKLRRMCGRVGEILTGGGTEFLFIRGLPLSERLYLKPASRFCGDVDVLVREKDRLEVEGMLLDSGFQYGEHASMRKSRASCMGQCEFLHQDTSIVLDLNWRLTGNLGIGNVETDVDGIWARAERYRGHEYVFAPEDELLELVRHVGHGHDFARGTLKTCVDVAALLLRGSRPVDWDTLHRQAERIECRQVLDLFAWFYERVYRAAESQPGSPAQDARFPGRPGVPGEHRAFSRTILLTNLDLAGRANSSWRAFLRAGIGFVAKLWATDRLTRAIRILALLCWPPRDVLVLLTGDTARQSVPARRMRHTAQLVAMAPALAIGFVMRLVLAIPRAWFASNPLA